MVVRFLGERHLEHRERLFERLSPKQLDALDAILVSARDHLGLDVDPARHEPANEISCTLFHEGADECVLRGELRLGLARSEDRAGLGPVGGPEGLWNIVFPYLVVGGIDELERGLNGHVPGNGVDLLGAEVSAAVAPPVAAAAPQCHTGEGPLLADVLFNLDVDVAEDRTLGGHQLTAGAALSRGHARSRKVRLVESHLGIATIGDLDVGPEVVSRFIDKALHDGRAEVGPFRVGVRSDLRRHDGDRLHARRQAPRRLNHVGVLDKRLLAGTTG